MWYVNYTSINLFKNRIVTELIIIKDRNGGVLQVGGYYCEPTKGMWNNSDPEGPEDHDE